MLFIILLTMADQTPDIGCLGLKGQLIGEHINLFTSEISSSETLTHTHHLEPCHNADFIQRPGEGTEYLHVSGASRKCLFCWAEG